MHSEVRADVLTKPATDRKEQQRIIDRWRKEFNHVRPHQALGGKTPAEVYKVGERRRAVVKSYAYPKHFYVGRVNGAGALYFRRDACRVGQPFCGLSLGIEVIDALRVRLWLHEVDLGTAETLPGVDDACFEQPLGPTTQKRRASAPLDHVAGQRAARTPTYSDGFR
jgi:hypothetical protein